MIPNDLEHRMHQDSVSRMRSRDRSHELRVSLPAAPIRFKIKNRPQPHLWPSHWPHHWPRPLPIKIPCLCHSFGPRSTSRVNNPLCPAVVLSLEGRIEGGDRCRCHISIPSRDPLIRHNARRRQVVTSSKNLLAYHCQQRVLLFLDEDGESVA